MRMLSTLLDVLFPPRETEKLVRNISENDTTLYTEAKHHNGTIFLLDYQKPIIRALIAENKFYQNTRATHILGRVLTAWVKEQHATVCFIPIPLSKKRLKERGYNQVTEILKRVSPDNTMVLDILTRTKHTTPQTELNRTERLNNMKGVFKLKKQRPEVPVDTIFVIVDDVVTTGATIDEAQAVLTPHTTDATLVTMALAH